MIKYKDLQEFFSDLNTDKSAQVEQLRKIIFDVEPTLVETIKWNAPNYAFNGEDRITFNVMNKQGLVKIVLHMGATKVENKNGSPSLENTDGLVEWNSDIRGTITFDNSTDIDAKEAALRRVLKDWLDLS